MGLKKNEPVNPHTATLVVNFWVFLFALFGINTDSFLSFLFCSLQKKGIKKWYFVSKIVLTFCEKKLFWWLIKVWGWRPKICKHFEITRTIYLNSERSVQFLKLNVFFTCSWMFLKPNKFKNLEFKLKKNIGI